VTGEWKSLPLDRLAARISDGSHNPPKGVEHSEFLMLSSKNVFDDRITLDSPRYLTEEDFKAEDRRTAIAPGDVLLTIVGTIGRAAVVPRSIPALTLQRSVAVIRPDVSAIEPRFLMYALIMSSDVLNSKARGVAQKGVYLQALRDFPIPHPPLSEQRRIVAILDDAFEAIATAKANTEKKLHNAREVFERSIVAMLRERGDDWNTSTIGEVCTLKSGTTVPIHVERPSGDIPYVKVAEMTMPENADGITTSTRFIDRSDLKPAWVIPAGAVIFPKRGGAILTNKKRLVLVDMCADLNIMSVIPSDLITPEFLYLFFLAVDMRKLGTGSSIPQINNYDIAPLSISFPSSKKLQQELTSRLTLIKVECDLLGSMYARKLDALDELKKSLLHRAFTGQLTAKSTDQQLAVVA
jgi:type I restriction enzyme S subunit